MHGFVSTNQTPGLGADVRVVFPYAFFYFFFCGFPKKNPFLDFLQIDSRVKYPLSLPLPMRATPCFFVCILFLLPTIILAFDGKKKFEIDLAGEKFTLTHQKIGPFGEHFWTNIYCDRRAIRVALNSLLSISRWVPTKDLPTIICGDQGTCDIMQKLGLQSFYPKALVEQVKESIPKSMPLGVPMMVRETIDKAVVLSGVNYCIFDADLVWLRNPWDVMLGGLGENATVLPEQTMELQVGYGESLYVRPFGHLPDGGIISAVLNNGLMCVRSTDHTRVFAEAFYKRMLEMAQWEPGFAQTSFSRAHEDLNLSLRPADPNSVSTGSVWTGTNDAGVLVRTLPVGAVAFPYRKDNVTEHTLLVHPVYGELDKSLAQEEKEKNLRVLGCWYLRNDWSVVMKESRTPLSIESLRDKTKKKKKKKKSKKKLK